MLTLNATINSHKYLPSPIHFCAFTFSANYIPSILSWTSPRGHNTIQRVRRASTVIVDSQSVTIIAA